LTIYDLNSIVIVTRLFDSNRFQTDPAGYPSPMSWPNPITFAAAPNRKPIARLHNQSKSEWEKFLSSNFGQLAALNPSSTRRNVGGTPKNKWTPREDVILAQTVALLGTDNWRAIAAKVRGRNGKQCRERWFGQMDPELSCQDWSPEEDLILISKQRQMGHQWAQIKQFLPGRSIVAVKNRFIWLSRRDIPKYSEEIQRIVATRDERVRTEEEHPLCALPHFDGFDFWIEPDFE
jgi:hypothetical protein